MEEKKILSLFLLLLSVMLSISSKAEAGSTLPTGSVSFEQSNVYGLVVDAKYSNLLSPVSALSFALAYGENEFRLSSTLGALLFPNHLFKVTAEYLSQQNQFSFISGDKTLWNQQHAVALEYAYLTHQGLSATHFFVYHAQSDDTQLPTIINFNVYGTALDRYINGATLFGGGASVIWQPCPASCFEMETFYDDVHYNKGSCSKDQSGLGLGGRFTQVLSPVLLFSIYANHRSFYNQYEAKVSWLLPARCLKGWELTVMEQYYQGDLPEPHETRSSLILAYHWPQFSANGSQQNVVLMSEVNQPIIKIPQTIVSKEQVISSISRTEKWDN